MITKLTLSSLLLLALSSFLTAEEISDEAIQKALEGITLIKVIENNGSKIISEVIITEKETTVKKKKVYTKKKSIKKRSIRKKKVEEDLSDLPMAQTLGVINKSKPFELSN